MIAAETKSYRSFFKSTSKQRWMPPHKKYVQYFEAHFNSSVDGTKHLLAGIVWAWISSLKYKKVNSASVVSGILELDSRKKI